MPLLLVVKRNRVKDRQTDRGNTICLWPFHDVGIKTKVLTATPLLPVNQGSVKKSPINQRQSMKAQSIKCSQ